MRPCFISLPGGRLRAAGSFLRRDFVDNSLHAFEQLVAKSVHLSCVLVDVKVRVVGVLKGTLQFPFQFWYQFLHLVQVNGNCICCSGCNFLQQASATCAPGHRFFDSWWHIEAGRLYRALS